MKNIRLFDTLAEYKDFIFEHIAVTPIFRENSYYRGLINFIIDHRTPLFFEASEPYEYAHFTQYFNLVLMRNTYSNRFIEDMFYMHDFLHMVFNNPLNVRDYSFEYFCEIANHNEYVASNDTEVLTYYRISGQRPYSIEHKILYDLLRNISESKPSPRELLELRKSIVLDNKDGELDQSEDRDAIFAFMRKFKDNNMLWCKTWYEGFPKIDTKYQNKPMTLPILEYESYLEYYRPLNDEARYKNNTYNNICLALSLLGEKSLPKTFDAAKIAVERLEGKIIMEDVAKQFHPQYMKNKEIGNAVVA